MAYDKIVDSAALDGALTATADAIRAKTSGTDKILWDNYTGFASAVSAISAGGGGGGLAYDMGTFTLSEDVPGNKFTIPDNATYGTSIPHNLGEVPGCVMVWTDHWAGTTADTALYSTNTMVGFLWLNGLTGMIGRASSAANTVNPIAIAFTIANNDYRVGVSYPTSASYGYPNDKWLPTDKYFRTYCSAANSFWRGGVQYNYFVSKAWWNVGGVANAE